MTGKGNSTFLETRITQLESEAEQLRQEIQQLRSEWATRRETEEIAEEYAALRQAVSRYAIACAEVEVQMAILRARGEVHPEALETFRRCVEEQTEASNGLRALARRLQNRPA